MLVKHLICQQTSFQILPGRESNVWVRKGTYDLVIYVKSKSVFSKLCIQMKYWFLMLHFWHQFPNGCERLDY